ncbi:MAG: pimeloyl-ACP methyl ester carboxylesterase [Gammaproteobacteria bacterium]|jgi:pimeloyl-ACP methyl ester carboxylesterase
MDVIGQIPDQVPAQFLGEWEQRAQRHHTPCGHGSMVWRSWGVGPPLLLIHGGAGAWSHWVRNLAGLTRSFTVIAPDLPGLGESASPPKPYTPESIAQIVVQGLAQLLGSDLLALASRNEQFAVCGFSFGGMVAGLVAERMGSAVHKLVLIGASGLGGQFDDLAPVYRLARNASAEELTELHRRNLQAMMLHAPESIDPLALFIQSQNAPRTRIMSPEHALTLKLADSLKRSQLPVASIWGEHCIFSGDLARRRALLNQISPGSSFDVIESAGHWAQYEAAAIVTPLLVQLLAKLPSGASR